MIGFVFSGSIEAHPQSRKSIAIMKQGSNGFGSAGPGNNHDHRAKQTPPIRFNQLGQTISSPFHLSPLADGFGFLFRFSGISVYFLTLKSEP
jgi:hypothetical protein